MFSKRWGLFAASLVILLAFVIRYVYFIPRYSKGETPPTVQANLVDGTPFDLTDLRGSPVLIYFWGSWCGPCIKQVPDLVNLYSGLNEKQQTLHVVSIAVEQNERRWKSALDRYQLPGKYHLIDKTTSLRFFTGPIAKTFGIKEIPTKYLLNENGQVMLVNPTFDEIQIWVNTNLPK